MKYSTNFNMNKPELNEQYSLSHWNDNTDIIDTEMQAIRSGTDEVMKATLLNFCYPIGSLYWSSKSTNPASLFGGTWVQIKDRFVLACGDTYKTVGATGGASDVTLSVSNMPSHNHSFKPTGTISNTGGHRHGPGDKLYNVYQPSGGSNNKNEPSYLSYFNTSKHWYDWSFKNNDNIISSENSSSTIQSSSVQPNFTGYAGYHSHTFSGSAGTTGSNGSGTSFSILPPYVVKYCFERTA